MTFVESIFVSPNLGHCEDVRFYSMADVFFFGPLPGGGGDG